MNMEFPPPSRFGFKDLEWREYFSQFVTPRIWKQGARDIPFGAGAKSLYVDVATGIDTNDGESWKTPLKTVSQAVTNADDWTNIFFLPGTYPIASKITVAKTRIGFIGASQSTTIFQTALSSDAFEVTGAFILFDGMEINFSGTTAEQIGIDVLGAEYFIARNMTFSRSGDQTSNGIVLGNIASLANVSRCIFEANTKIQLLNTSFTTVEHCQIPYVLIAEVTLNSTKNRFYENELTTVQLNPDVDYNSFFHNNFSSPAITDNGSNNKFFHNYYSTHTNVDNGFGIAKTPYSFTGGSDPRPVVHRDGWHGLSYGSTLSDILSTLKLEALHESFFFPEDTNGTITFTAGGTANTFGAWLEIVDNNAVTFSSKFASNTGHISSLSVENVSTANKVYFLEISYGASKTIISRHRFIIAAGQLTPLQTRIRVPLIPAGETVYYRMKCETASATGRINFKYHFH